MVNLAELEANSDAYAVLGDKITDIVRHELSESGEAGEIDLLSACHKATEILMDAFIHLEEDSIPREARR